jgi:hypothetical protein
MENIAAVPIVQIESLPQSNASIQNAPVIPTKPENEPFSLYKDMNQMPYTASYFGMSKSQYFALQQADITDLSQKMDGIENTIKEQILTGNFDDSTNTFKQIMEDASEQLGIKPYESAATKIEKLFIYFTGGKVGNQYHMKRSSKAETLDQARHQAMKSLNKNYPNKSSRLINFKKFF